MVQELDFFTTFMNGIATSIPVLLEAIKFLRWGLSVALIPMRSPPTHAYDEYFACISVA